MATGIFCYAFCARGRELAMRLLRALDRPASEIRVQSLLMPRRLCEHDRITPFDNLQESVAHTWQRGLAHVFIGASGIAVRAIAPHLAHKSTDPPVVVLDPGGNFCISLLSGHLGGANELATALATLLGAIPVITTASDVQKAPALDLLLRDAGLAIKDWRELPALQGRLLEGQTLNVRDPFGFLPRRSFFCHDQSRPAQILPVWRNGTPIPGVMRVVPEIVAVGVGFRKDVIVAELERGYRIALARAELDSRAIGLVCSIKAKMPQVRELAQRLGVASAGFGASSLAKISTPGASEACGRRFGQQPFSVCEASALLGARTLLPDRTAVVKLLAAKTVVAARMTFAFAIGLPCKQSARGE